MASVDGMGWDDGIPLFDTLRTGLTDNPSAIDTNKNMISDSSIGHWITFGPSGKPISSVPGKAIKPGDIK